MFRALTLLTAVLLAGCAPDFEPAAPPTDGSALIYFYRMDEVGYRSPNGAVHISVDSKNVLDLDQATYAHAYVASGTHDLAMTFVGGPGLAAHLAVIVAPNQVLYVGCGTVITASGGIDVMLDDALRVVDSGHARAHIARYHLQKMPD